MPLARLDALGELARAVPELWIASPHAPARKRIRSAGLEDRVRLVPAIDAALER